MQVDFFDVEHGACALVACDDNTRLMIDCGHNVSTGWTPADHLRDLGVGRLDMLAVTNYDEDHVSGICEVLDEFDPRWLWCNTKVSPQDIRKLKSQDGMGRGIDRLVNIRETQYTGVATASPKPTFAGIRERKSFTHAYPTFDDENNLSMVVFLDLHGVGFLFPGDLEQAGWLEMLKLDSFKDALRRTKVLLASHHGRESGICDEIFDYCRPQWIVISDKGYAHTTQETVPYYRNKASGGLYSGETRHVLTTRNDGHIRLAVKSS